MNQSEYNAVPVGEGYWELKGDEVISEGDMMLGLDCVWTTVHQSRGLGFQVLKVELGHQRFQARVRRSIHV